MYNQYYPPTYQLPMITQSNIIWVDNDEEARNRARQLSPGITIIMLDNNRPVAYKGSADMSGKIMPVEVFELCVPEETHSTEAPDERVEYITRQDFERFKASVEQRLSNLKKKGDKA